MWQSPIYEEFGAIIVRAEKLANVDRTARKGEQARTDKMRSPGADGPLHKVFEVGKTGLREFRMAKKGSRKGMA